MRTCSQLLADMQRPCGYSFSTDLPGPAVLPQHTLNGRRSIVVSRAPSADCRSSSVDGRWHESLAERRVDAAGASNLALGESQAWTSHFSSSTHPTREISVGGYGVVHADGAGASPEPSSWTYRVVSDG
jgi:hypothetical protein